MEAEIPYVDTMDRSIKYGCYTVDVLCYVTYVIKPSVEYAN